MRTTMLMGVLAAMVFAAAPAVAQRGGPANARMDRDRARVGSPLERQVERALARRDQLGLTETQIIELESLRSDIEGALAPLREEGRSLRSEARDRSGEPDEVRARMDATRTRARALRARSDTVLAGLEQRFEQAVPPLQRRELERAGRSGRRPAAARGGGSRGGDRSFRSRGAHGRTGVARGARGARGWLPLDARPRGIGRRVG